MFKFSNHALEQIRQRNIDFEKVLALINRPQQRLIQDYLTVFQGVIDDVGGKYLLRIFVNLLKEPPLVVTVYKTSKINKYWQ